MLDRKFLLTFLFLEGRQNKIGATTNFYRPPAGRGVRWGNCDIVVGPGGVVVLISTLYVLIYLSKYYDIDKKCTVPRLLVAAISLDLHSLGGLYLIQTLFGLTRHYPTLILTSTVTHVTSYFSDENENLIKAA